MSQNVPSGTARQKTATKKLLAWIGRQGRVTVADLAARSSQPARVAAKRLFAAESDGLLVREGGGPGEAFYWRKAQ